MIRGIACIAVCAIHFLGTVSPTLSKGYVQIAMWGLYVFFIFSGFILPYSLYKSGYKIKHYHRYLWKRLIRIEPPYLLSILIIVLLSFLAQLSPNHTSKPIELLNLHLFYNVTYLVDIVNDSWLNVVFWSLAIELQFYILVGVIYPLIVHSKWIYRYLLILPLAILAYFFKDDAYVFHYFTFFLVGIVLFQFYIKLISVYEFFFSSLGLTVLLTLQHHWGGLVCPIFAILGTFYLQKPWKPLIFMGTISYSLYLLHIPVGTDAFVQFFQNYVSSTEAKIVLAILGFLFSIACSWIFYLLIELPFKNLAKKVRYQ
jgi:peptidoglycan/LPS O-acetylase OafA/YrhL